MRLFVVKQASDLQSLSSQLLDGGSKPAPKSAARTAALERVKLLNPHVDFRHIEAGTVLALPDSAEIKESQGRSIAGDAFARFADDATAGMNAIAQQVRDRMDVIASDHAELAAVLKTAVVKRAVVLKSQLSDAERGYEDDQGKARSAKMQIEAMQEAIARELKTLADLVG